MSDFEFHSIGLFTFEQSQVQVPDRFFLFFHLSGLDYFRVAGYELVQPGAFICLLLPGEYLQFDFSRQRKNWVLQLNSDCFLAADGKTTIQLNWQGNQCTLPKLFHLTDDQAQQWHHRFQQLNQMHLQPTPINQLLRDLAVYDVIRNICAMSVDTAENDPAGKLKELIEYPDNFSKPISVLCGECDYSVDHLRVLFKKQYQISPQQYRIRCRMSYCMELIANSTLSLKEIAFKAGFSHLSHFSSLFSRTYGIAGRTAIEKYRNY